MDKLATIQGQKLVGTTVGFSSKNTIKYMDRLAIIQSQGILETKVRF